MAREDSSTSASTPSQTDMERFADVIAKGIAMGMAANAPKRKVTHGEFQARLKVQPDGTASLKLKRPLIQNGISIQPEAITNVAVGLLNRLTHSGRYINRLVEVIINQDTADEVVELRYNCASADQRMENKSHWRSFEDLMTQLVEAQEMEDLEQAERKDSRRPNAKR